MSAPLDLDAIRAQFECVMNAALLAMKLTAHLPDCQFHGCSCGATGEFAEARTNFFREERKLDIRPLFTEIEALRAWVSDLQSGMYINCVYCGHRYGPAGIAPATLVENPPPTATMAEALRDHIEQCPKHPMSTLRKSVEALRAARCGLCGFQAGDMELQKL